MATSATPTAATAVSNLTAILGTKGVQVGKLAILTTSPVSVVTPNMAAIVMGKAILINRGRSTRIVLASSVDPVTGKGTMTQDQTWGPQTLASGAMAVLPTPPQGLGWYVVDVTRRTLRDVQVAGWVVFGIAALGAGTGAYIVVKDVRRHLHNRSPRRS